MPKRRLPVISKERNWLGRVGPDATRRVFGISRRTPTQAAAAALTWIQRKDLTTLDGRTLEDAKADLAVIVRVATGQPIDSELPFKARRAELSTLAAQLAAVVTELKKAGTEPRESAMQVPPGLRHKLILDPTTNTVRGVFAGREFLSVALWQLRLLIADHMHKIAACRRCEKWFLVGKRHQVFCGTRCAAAVRVARFASRMDPIEARRRRQRTHFGRLLEKDPGAAAIYIRRLGRRDPEAARLLKSTYSIQIDRLKEDPRWRDEQEGSEKAQYLSYDSIGT